jgi:hypothetical protein
MAEKPSMTFILEMILQTFFIVLPMQTTEPAAVSWKYEISA